MIESLYYLLITTAFITFIAGMITFLNTRIRQSSPDEPINPIAPIVLLLLSTSLFIITALSTFNIEQIKCEHLLNTSSTQSLPLQNRTLTTNAYDLTCTTNTVTQLPLSYILWGFFLLSFVLMFISVILFGFGGNTR